MAAGIKIRLFVDHALSAGAGVDLDDAKAHYLTHVMRKTEGERVALFNGRDGEWSAAIAKSGKGRCRVLVESRLRPQTQEPDLWLCFAPIKRARIDFVGEKATELGVSVLQPIVTRRTIVERVNLERLAANAVEAAESSHRLSVPDIRPPVELAKLIANWPQGRRLILCDETGAGRPMAEALRDLPDAPSALLIGPEGGFEPDEFRLVRSLAEAVPVDLGPRLMRADTAALAALAAYQAIKGDWRKAVGKSLAMP